MQSLVKKHINADYSDLTNEFGLTHKVPRFKVGDRVKIIIT